LSIRAIEKHIAKPLGITTVDAAHGIRAVANAAMSRAIRAVTVERGRDPRDFTLIAMGGNGGIHAVELAPQLGIRRVIVPPLSGVFSAAGMLGADIEHTHLTTLLHPLDDLPESALQSHMDGLETEIRRRLQRDGYSGDRTALIWQADLRHEGQASELTVPFDPGPGAKRQMAERFLAEYLKTYGYRDATPIDLVKLRLIGRGLRVLRLDFSAMRAAPRPGDTMARSRAVSFGRGEPFVETPVVSRHALDGGARKGPLIIDEFDATIVVPPNVAVSRDTVGSIVMEFGMESGGVS
jgi:N-methylhydantoinase A